MSITLVIIIITCLVSYQAFQDRALRYKLSHSPYQEAHQKEYYRFVSAAFVHGSGRSEQGDWFHLIINMFVLYQFGNFVEERFVGLFGEMMGRINYILLYFLTVIFANIPTFLQHKDNHRFSSVGASGAVSGILFVYVIFQPWSLLLLFFIIPIPAIIAAILFLFYSTYAAKKGQDSIDHSAHFYGAVFGFWFAIALKPGLFSMFLDNLVKQFPL